jgi:hypothetical protein
MLINVSNHPSVKWPEEQLRAAKELSGCGVVVDVPHPPVPPEADEQEVGRLAWQVLDQIAAAHQRHKGGSCTNCLVHLMGEAGFVDYLNQLLRLRDIHTVYSTTAREVVEQDGNKVSRFRFVRFREYLSI